MDSNPLDLMLQKQQAFQQRLDPNFTNMDVRERVAFIKEHSIHLMQEVNEMLYELPYFKPWKNYEGMCVDDMEKARIKACEELIDAWHFFMNIMLALGLDAEQFEEMYHTKNKENHTRQDDGYTFDKSYRESENNNA